jgi:hypothetical protein
VKLGEGMNIGQKIYMRTNGPDSRCYENLPQEIGLASCMDAKKAPGGPEIMAAQKYGRRLVDAPHVFRNVVKNTV